MDLLTINEAKDHLRIELDFNDDDIYIESLVKAAKSFIEKSTHAVLVQNEDDLKALPEDKRGFIVEEDIKLAAKLLISHWFDNRSIVAEGNYTELPLSVDCLLFHYRDHAIG